MAVGVAAAVLGCMKTHYPCAIGVPMAVAQLLLLYGTWAPIRPTCGVRDRMEPLLPCRHCAW